MYVKRSVVACATPPWDVPPAGVAGSVAARCEQKARRRQGMSGVHAGMLPADGWLPGHNMQSTQQQQGARCTHLAPLQPAPGRLQWRGLARPLHHPPLHHPRHLLLQLPRGPPVDPAAALSRQQRAWRLRAIGLDVCDEHVPAVSTTSTNKRPAQLLLLQKAVRRPAANSGESTRCIPHVLCTEPMAACLHTWYHSDCTCSCTLCSNIRGALGLSAAGASRSTTWLS